MIDDSFCTMCANSMGFSPDNINKNNNINNNKLRVTSCCNDPLRGHEDRKSNRVSYTAVAPPLSTHRFLRKYERNTFVNIIHYSLVLILFCAITVTSEVLQPTGSSLLVNEGSPVTLLCEDITDIDAATDSQVRWEHNGQFILQNQPLGGPWYNERRGTIEEGNTTLRIYSTRLEDAGRYTCIKYLYDREQERRELRLIVHDSTPEIDPVEQDGILSEYDTLSLTCHGGLFITWKYPESVATRVQISFRTEGLGKSILSRRQISVLTIENVIYTDTGKYQCVHHHSSDDDTQDSGDDVTDEVYIFVTQPKGSTTLFIPSSSDTPINAYADDVSITIPCKVTNPLAKVSLITYEISENGTEGPMLEIRDNPYDPQQGFVISSSQFNQLNHKVRCVATMGTLVDQQEFTFNYIGQPDVVIQFPSGTLIVDQMIVVKESDKSLEIACSGQLPLLWSYPNTARQKITEQTTAISNPITNTDLHYRSVLTLTNMSYSETGEYACVFIRYVGTPLETEQRKAQYVYITSTDTSNTFLPETNEIIKVHPNEPFTVPCRSSNPKYTINYSTFYTNGELYFELEKNRTVKYDPRYGYTFGVQDGGKIIPNLNIYCWTSVGSDFQVATSVYYVLLQVGDNNGVLFPRIFPSSDPVIQGQSRVNVTCLVSIEEKLFSRLTEDFHPRFDITYPGKLLNSNSSNYEVGETEEKYNTTHVFFCYVLYINEVSLVDMGTYMCLVDNAAGRANATTELSVLEQGFVRIQNKTNLDIVEVIDGSKEFCQVHFDVDAFPTPVSYVWRKDGDVIDSSVKEDPDNPSFDIDGPTLCIRHVDVRYEGNYTLLASNQYEEDEVTIQLKVLVKPTVTVTTDPQPIDSILPNLFEVDKNYKLNCSATGNPTPTVWWDWFACEVNDDKCEPPKANSSSWKRLSTQELGSSNPSSPDSGEDIAEYQQQQNVAITEVNSPRYSGFYRCVAQSPKFEIQYQLLTWFLTENEDGFAIEDTNVEQYATQNVELSCKASIYAYKYIRWKRRDPVTNETVFVIPFGSITDADGRIFINPDRTAFSHTSSVNIHSLNSTDGGEYFCIGKQRYGPRVKLPMTLTVKDLISPVITNGLVKITKLDKSKSGYHLSCMASGDPRPSMIWRMDGRERYRAAMLKTNVEGIYQSTFTLSSPIRDQDGGMYTCEAYNIGGVANSSTKVLILESPKANADVQLVQSKLGKNATLVCSVSGIPTPTMTWKHTTDDQQYDVPTSRYRNNGRMLYFKELAQEDAGVYECMASNDLGEDSATIVLNIDIPRSPLETFVIPVVIVAAVLIVIFILLIIIVMKKWCAGPGKALSTVSDDFGNYLEPSQLPNYIQDIPYDPRWEFPKERIQLGPVIGKGAFGQVVRAVAVGIGSTTRSTTCAVKMLREDAAENEYKALMDELKMLIHVGRHLNVVNFLGACTQQVPVLLIVEYCRYGNLCHYLRSKRETFIGENGCNLYTSEPISRSDGTTSSSTLSRVTRSLEDLMSDESQQDYTRISDDEDEEDKDGQSLSVQDLVCYSFQIARGMEFLASKKCIHRDLAARNVLVAENNIVKICDFGLSRNLYYDPDYIAKSKGLLPIKWMAPESIFDKIFTTQSDVWSFGIVMWEVFCLGGSPYPGFQVDERFYDKLKYGYRMSRPDYASADIYQIMLECWHKDPKQRPNFGELVKTIGERLQDGTREEYMDLSAAHEKDYWEIPDSIQHSNSSNHLPGSHPTDEDESTSPDGIYNLEDRPPDHPPLPIPRTLEKQPKKAPILKQVPKILIEDDCPTPSPPHATLVWKSTPVTSSSPLGSRSNGNHHPVSPRDVDARQRPVSSIEGRQPPSTLLNGRQQRPVSTSDMNVGKNGKKLGNLEMCRVFFPSNDDMNVTCPMISNPVVGQQEMISPTVKECSPLLDRETPC